MHTYRQARADAYHSAPCKYAGTGGTSAAADVRQTAGLEMH
jgi:hypothetical protein